MFVKAGFQIIFGLHLNRIAGAESLDEQITPVRHIPEWERAIPARRVFLMAFILLTSFSAVSIGVTIVAPQAKAPPDPFATYNDIMPGGPRSAVEARGFSCQSNTYNDYPIEGYETCALDIATGVISQIQVDIDHDSISKTSFFMRENSVRIGDLNLWLGAPYDYRDPSQAFFSWRKHFMFAWAFGGRSPFFRPVQSVTFINID